MGPPPPALRADRAGFHPHPACAGLSVGHAAAAPGSRQLHPSQLFREPDPGLHRDHRHRRLGSNSIPCLDDLRRVDAGPAGAGGGGRDRRGSAVAGVRQDHSPDPPACVPRRHPPFHDLRPLRVQPGLAGAHPPPEPGLLPDVRLFVPGVVPGQPVRTRITGSGDHDRHPGRRDVRLRAADGATDRGGGVSRRVITRTFFDTVAGLILVVMLFPIYWMVSTALKPGKEILSLTPVWFPSPVTFDNFRSAINYPFFWNDVVNSLTVVLSVVAISIVLAFLAAVSVARVGFRGRTAFVRMVIAAQILPLTAFVIPVYLLLDKVGQVDSLLRVIAYYLAICLPFMIWTLRGFVATVPVDLEEAAMVDGATRVGALLPLVFPLPPPPLVAPPT